MPVLAGAEPFTHSGSTEVGVLLCHGFTGTPASMRPWGEHLAAEGFTVRCPRLPGHGTTWREMNRTTWTDWYDCVDAGFAALRGECESAFVFGLSMGGTLALRLAQRHGADVSGLVLVNPSVTTLRKDAKLLPVLSKVIPSVKGVAGDVAKPGVTEIAYDRTPVRAAASLSVLWRLVRAELPAVTQPLLLLRSVVDHIVEPVNGRIIMDRVGSANRTEVLLRDSFHVATIDNDAPEIFERSVEFVRSVRQVGAR
ncbi:esterase [Prauserella marina]|uniref:Carboxylesterase n=1 Tax=Prauserella marina TaxID=530584 RepID=A0A222VNG6_9PSEU|nr:alpha/beta fold hydrolase [Prauserella marina]ASR35392.1 esterase [Prauserella marina]PWV84808.1 esterase/lipase [Prauserella marina]SDC12627.1 carboxylesterase [Prauserella marina]